jgi:hypothetical protein
MEVRMTAPTDTIPMPQWLVRDGCGDAGRAGAPPPDALEWMIPPSELGTADVWTLLEYAEENAMRVHVAVVPSPRRLHIVLTRRPRVGAWEQEAARPLGAGAVEERGGVMPTDAVTARVWHEAVAAADAAGGAGVPVDVFRTLQNYRARVSQLRAWLAAGCQGCGAAFRTPADVRFTYWERLPASHVYFACGPCAAAITRLGFRAWRETVRRSADSVH